MPEFIMDREGVVNGMTFDDLSEIFQGYIEAMLFTETSYIPMTAWHFDESKELIREGEADGSIPHDSGWGDIDPTSAERAQLDVFNFEVEVRALLQEAYERDYSPKQAGRDFWYTRNGHGCGFWDRKELDAGDLGDRLSAIAKGFGTSDADFSEAPDDASPTGYGYVYLT